MIVSGECLITFSVTDLTMPAFVSMRSSLLIPGFLGNPEVIMTTSEPAVLEPAVETDAVEDPAVEAEIAQESASESDDTDAQK